jgi:hypothetical protein
MAFQKFVLSAMETQLFGDTPEQDFVSDSDCRVFKEHEAFKTWSDLHNFLLWCHACPEAIKAGRNVWEVYVKTEKEKARAR